MRRSLRTCPPRRGFTLVEAMVALMIATMSGSALFLALNASLQTTQHSLEQAIANGIAEQVVDEILGTMWTNPGAAVYQYPFSPNTYEAAGKGRERYNDTDDYHGFTAKPPQDCTGVELGRGDGAGAVRHSNFCVPTGYFANWRQEIEMYYVSNTNPSVRLTGSNTSNFRAVEVKIYRTDTGKPERKVTTVRRVFSYIPSP